MLRATTQPELLSGPLGLGPVSYGTAAPPREHEQALGPTARSFTDYAMSYQDVRHHYEEQDDADDEPTVDMALVPCQVCGKLWHPAEDETCGSVECRDKLDAWRREELDPPTDACDEANGVYARGKAMTDAVKLALKLTADPALSGRTWKQVRALQRLSEEDDVPGERFCSVMYSNWIYANFARLILAGDDEGLLAFIETVDPARVVRDKRVTDA